MIRQAMQLLRSAAAHADQRGGELVRLEATVPNVREFQHAIEEAMQLAGLQVEVSLREKPGVAQVVSVEVGPAPAPLFKQGS